MSYRRVFLIVFFVISAFILFESPSKADEGVNTKTADQVTAPTASNEVKSKKRSAPELRQKLLETVTEEPAEEKYPWEWDSFVKYSPARSLYGQEGKISITDAESELSYSFKAAGRLPIQLSIASEYIGISDKDFSALSLPAHMTGLSFGAQGTFPFFFDKTYLRVKVTPSFFSQNWNTQASSFRIPTLTYWIYQPNQKWTLIAGFAAFPRYETTFAPVFGFIYQPNDRLTFNIVPSEPYISYQLNKMLGVFVSGGLSGGEYRVTKDGYKNAILQFNETHADAGFVVTFNKNVDLNFSAGYMFNRYLQYRDSLGKVDIKNGMYTEFRLEMRI